MSSPALIDRAHLDAQTFGDADLAREVLALFAHQCAVLLPRIREDGPASAPRADLVHTLRGSALGVGAAALAALCAEVEAGLRAGDPAPPGLADIARVVADTLAAIDRLGPDAS
ncbi:Hpt domain-containing protein [Methylobacterium sp. Leaf108]|uniref:Hpt domain-containing protein n=1 Tax=Methylobacterium sp. Leaf108 TaxID=1736256 RepID=UPI0006F9630B|nr:Hpt domain-containing protein [Methylobacterium sp. Leaf108]KQP50478.1 hypothetical protein ASF39_12345 [Methylobacterium sp. Leaf108]